MTSLFRDNGRSGGHRLDICEWSRRGVINRIHYLLKQNNLLCLKTLHSSIFVKYTMDMGGGMEADIRYRPSLHITDHGTWQQNLSTTDMATELLYNRLWNLATERTPLHPVHSVQSTGSTQSCSCITQYTINFPTLSGGSVKGCGSSFRLPRNESLQKKSHSTYTQTLYADMTSIGGPGTVNAGC
jgi:hypothetical protein